MSRSRCGLAVLLFAVVLSAVPRAAHALSLDLTWEYTNNSAAPATGFYLRRSNLPNLDAFTGAPIALSIVMRAYRDDELVEHRQYCYYLTAISAAGVESVPSNVACLTYDPPAVPTAPTLVRGTWRP